MKRGQHRRRLIVSALAAALPCGDARAETVTGTHLSSMCARGEVVASYYVLGAVDAFNVRVGAPKRFCIPRDAALPGDHLTNIACRYIAEHPGERDLQAAVLIYRSLRDAYPCGPRR